ncbi:hypothetical protein [Chryseobacterium sp. RR2-3-20]|uniref:hypothetical protein n=1 Tax=Chryseobacterium sp. RR2-3-20 TaxID=2787626 RepID=UPI001AE05FE8|nr:hypothetical protein [Chryseobacterium sp. RR2-3-20]
MENTYASELVNWAEKAINICKTIAEDYHLDYYAFQKPCNLKSKNLILALNPFSNYAFPSKKVDKRIESTLDSQKFLQGNSKWNGYQTNWKVLRQLMKMKIIYDMELDFNYMNYVYFPSKKFIDIKKIKEVNILETCKDLTLEFINILQPENIILLGTSSGMDEFEIDGEVLLVGNDNKRLIIRGKIGNHKVFAIPHPSWLSDDELCSIDLNLRQINLKQKQSGFISLHNMPKLSRHEIDETLHSLITDNMHQKFTDILLDGIEDDKLLIRVNYIEKNIGVRNASGKDFYALKHVDFYKSFFSNIIIENKNSWAFMKKFPSHFFTENSDISNEIINFAEEINKNRK